MDRYALVTCIIAGCMLSSSFSYRILHLSPLPSGSHGILSDAFVKLLLEAGHEVTYITALTKMTAQAKLKIIDVSSNFKTFPDNFLNIKSIMAKESDMSVNEFFFPIMDNVSLATLKNEEVLKIMNDEIQQFDVVVAEWMYNELYAGWKYDNVNKIFIEMYAPIFTKRGRPTPSYEDVRYNGSLILGNSNPVLGHATKLPQNYKSIGGFHIQKTPPPLPENLKKIMDNSKHGVIYFSMGSNLRSSDWPLDIKRGMLKMFGKLKQTVLWKFEEKLDDAPSNVHILNWAPQQSILAHPNCVLFITHSGLLSSTEAVHFGVPVIGLPVFADQFVNILRAVTKGYGRKVELTHAMVGDMESAIQDVTSNPRYRETAKVMSAAYHDRPVMPQKEIVHWVEHVIRTNGAKYLLSPALMMPWYQKMYFDLLTLITFTITAVFLFIKYLFIKHKRSDNKEKKN